MTAPTERDGLELETGFSIVPHWLLDTGVGSVSIHLYALLARHADSRTRVAFPGRAHLMTQLGVKRTALDQAMNRLVAARAVVKRPRYGEDGRQKSNVYLIRTNPWGEVPATRQGGTAQAVGGVDGSTNLSTAPTAQTAGALPRRRAHNKNQNHNTYSPEDARHDAREDPPCPHETPGGYPKCPLCRHAARFGARHPAPTDTDLWADPAAFAAGDRSHREDDQ